MEQGMHTDYAEITSQLLPELNAWPRKHCREILVQRTMAFG